MILIFKYSIILWGKNEEYTSLGSEVEYEIVRTLSNAEEIIRAQIERLLKNELATHRRGLMVKGIHQNRSESKWWVRYKHLGWAMGRGEQDGQTEPGITQTRPNWPIRSSS